MDIEERLKIIADVISCIPGIRNDRELLKELCAAIDPPPFTAIKPKELNGGGKARNMAEDDFEKIRGATTDHLDFPGVPYWNELTAEEKDSIASEDADGNVAEEEPKPRYGDCECGAEATYGKDAPHSTWCAKYRRWK